MQSESCFRGGEVYTLTISIRILPTSAWDSFMTNVDQMLYTGSTPTPVAPVPTYAYTT